MTMMLQQAGAAGVRLSAAGYKALLLHVQPGEDARPRLDCAVALARRLGSTLIGVGAEAVPPIGVTDPYGMMDAQWLVEMQRLIGENLKEAEALFRKTSAGLAAEWVRVQAPPAEAVARVAREADLIIAGGACRVPGGPYRQCDTAELMFKSGRPVLIAPQKGGELRAENVLVGWKDTREARRALADSLPFLALAKAVTVLEICPSEAGLADAETRVASVVAGLKRHGVEAVGQTAVARAEEVAFELDIAAASMDADLMVVGGYSHSRLGEWVFGGVTLDLLNQNDRFVLMSH